MTNYSTQVIAGTGISPLFSSDKGDISNRLECAGQQIKNNLKAGGTGLLIGGAAVGAGYAVKKSSKVANFLAKPISKGAELIKNTSFGKYISKLPNKYKAMILIGVGAFATVLHFSGKYSYQAGQIDQKYTDKAALKKRATEVI